MLNSYEGMLDHIIVDLGDVKLPLNQIAVVSVIDSKTLSVNPFDPTVSNYQLGSCGMIL